MTFRLGLYSSHFGEVRGVGIKQELAEGELRDPLKRMADWLIDRGMTTHDELARLQRDEEQKIEESFNTVRSEVRV
jgi:TPP-dependent pyruvate/acetoin dehydrogenase alpha subunit